MTDSPTSHHIPSLDAETEASDAVDDLRGQRYLTLRVAELVRERSEFLERAQKAETALRRSDEAFATLRDVLGVAPTGSVLGGVDTLKARAEKAEAALAEANERASRTHCAYCGHQSPAEDFEAMRAHQATCERRRGLPPAVDPPAWSLLHKEYRILESIVRTCARVYDDYQRRRLSDEATIRWMLADLRALVAAGCEVVECVDDAIDAGGIGAPADALEKAIALVRAHLEEAPPAEPSLNAIMKEALEWYADPKDDDGDDDGDVARFALKRVADQSLTGTL